MTTGFKAFLVIYRYFYGGKYMLYVDFKGKRLNHLKAIYLYRLLFYSAINIKLFGKSGGYEWLKNYPSQCNRFDNDLSIVDTKKEEIKDFYKDEYDDERLESFVDSLIIEKLDLFKSLFLSDEVIGLLKKAKHPVEDWMGILVSIVFIKNEQMPGAGYFTVIKELKRTIRWSGDELNKKAWEVLQKAGIIKVD